MLNVKSPAGRSHKESLQPSPRLSLIMINRHCDRCVELLYFEGCPSYKRVWQELFEVIEAAGVDACVRPLLVATTDEAWELGFPGSPSVRVNGVDIEGYEGPGILSCRVYAENGGKNWPSSDLLKRALVAAPRGTV